jgi:phosphatidylethanolamine/phosphatidyl-N-methylethanolamine N-methyltransferase
MDLNSIRKAYKRQSKIYNSFFGWVFNPGRETAMELVDLTPGNRILEVGVGTGLSLPLYPKNVEIYGIDISKEMLVQAKELKDEEGLDHVKELLIMDAENMTFKDNFFDSVVAMYVASVVPHPKKFVDEMKRVCKPRGRIVIINHFYRPERVSGKLIGLLGPMSKFLGFRPNFSLDHFLEDTGLKVSNKIPINVLDMWTILIVENEK